MGERYALRFQNCGLQIGDRGETDPEIDGDDDKGPEFRNHLRADAGLWLGQTAAGCGYWVVGHGLNLSETGHA